MKALSIIQPWPYAILHFGKDIENRSWRTGFRGRFLIHASRGFLERDYHWLVAQGFALPPPAALPRGGIVGEAVLRDCVRASASRWFTGEFGFVLQGVRPLPFVPCRGRQGFWDVPGGVLAVLQREAAA